MPTGSYISIPPIRCHAIPVAAPSKAWVCGRSLAGIAGLESRRRHGCLSLVNVVFCQAEASASGRSQVQRSPTECGQSECDREASMMMMSWPTKADSPWKEKYAGMVCTGNLLLLGALFLGLIGWEVTSLRMHSPVCLLGVRLN